MNNSLSFDQFNLLNESFYLNDDVVTISKCLLGHILVTEIDGQLSAGKIVETEAYRAPDDQACHAHANRFTKRTKTMFLRGGVAYVYTCYGIHQMINVVTATEGKAHAILIRAVEPIHGMDLMSQRRGIYSKEVSLVNGPGKLTKAMGIHGGHDAMPLYDPNSPVRICHGQSLKEEDIVSSKRVGLSIHTGVDAHRMWRFYIKDNAWVSYPRKVEYPNIPEK